MCTHKSPFAHKAPRPEPSALSTGAQPGACLLPAVCSPTPVRRRNAAEKLLVLALSMLSACFLLLSSDDLTTYLPCDRCPAVDFRLPGTLNSSLGCNDSSDLSLLLCTNFMPPLLVLVGVCRRCSNPGLNPGMHMVPPRLDSMNAMQSERYDENVEVLSRHVSEWP